MESISVKVELERNINQLCFDIVCFGDITCACNIDNCDGFDKRAALDRLFVFIIETKRKSATSVKLVDCMRSYASSVRNHALRLRRTS